MLKSMIASIVAKKMRRRLDLQTIQKDDIADVLKEIRIALLDADVNLQVVKKFIEDIEQKAVGQMVNVGQDPQQIFLTIIKDELINILGRKTQGINYALKPLKIMLVGLQGSGKTTSIGKLATLLKTKHEKNPLMVALDVYRPAAIEQLRTLSQEVKCNFYEKGTQAPATTAIEALELAETQNNDAILFDTAGRLQTNQELMDELVSIKKAVHPDEIIMVVDGLSGQEIINVATEFHRVLKLTGIVITKLDSDARAGAALSLTSLLDVPIKFTGIGERLGSLDLFYPERMADRILGLGDVMTLAEKAADTVDEKDAMKTMQKMLSGRMDLDDLMKQMSAMSKMGSLGSIMKMVPGAGKISDDKIEEVEQKLGIWKIMMSSMTLKERRQPKLLQRDSSRKVRIIKGSGRKPDELNKLLKEWDTASKKMEQMGKMLQKGRNPFLDLMKGGGGFNF
ncbi:signal recognition particle protein [[Mycoplasma] testudinis]|uniref:signal recognition particle protein n=1 Tax=[Mycoplasma] testudinis TaxID=33924 RepID=UPI000480177C|nr:signal recognition particle protein [[Mycoplasma] testudinis]